MKENSYPYRYFFASLSLICLLLADYLVCYHYPHINAMFTLPHLFIVISLCLAIVFNLLMYKYIVTGFLFTVFFSIISARIAALEGFYPYGAILVGSLLIQLIFYRYYANFCINRADFSVSNSLLIFLRMYIGFNFIPHFTEKLFAGSIPRLADVNAFISMGIPYPTVFVELAGICELIIAISIGLGILTRAGAIFAAIYLFVATYLGHHFSLGFIWANVGGGWEYPVLWIVLVLIFAVIGSIGFSLDSLIMKKYRLSERVKWLME